MSRPGGEGQADARAGYAGAIPKTKSGAYDCEGVGAKCDKIEQDVPHEAVANLKEGADPEVIKESEKVKEEKIAEDKKHEEKGTEPETGTPGDEKEGSAVPVEPVKPAEPKEEKAEKAAAFAQHRHHHKRHHKHH